ncbi:hypothetical protein AQUCO_10900012v1 [Aquilegia coerulea]|uniref:PsbP C-terminal domain-containing protein n=2 Tax=Aquilegia coerulea TaxID=218851 RepID=A0A2G5C315_AQUCA|nr:hypothetical protein AQUCO_10900012v1 [Aquilegia coerulea]
MAPVSSLCSQSKQTQIWDSTASSQFQRVKRCRNPFVVHMNNKKQLEHSSICLDSVCLEEKEEGLKKNWSTKRREALFQTAFAAFSLPAIFSNALAESSGVEGFLVYTDDAKKFKILIPTGWFVGEGKSDGIRSLTAFYPEEESSTNVSVLVSGLGADYTKLESFGKVEEFAETLVSGLDRSWQNPPGVAAKLLSAKASKGMYYIEYSLQKPGESSRHIYSVLGMQSSQWYNKLYTVTGQFMENESEKYRSKIEKAVSSFMFI